MALAVNLSPVSTSLESALYRAYIKPLISHKPSYGKLSQFFVSVYTLTNSVSLKVQRNFDIK